MVSVSIDPPEVNAAFRAGLGARWTFLSDPDRHVQTQLRLREATDTLNNPYVPAVVVISRPVLLSLEGARSRGRVPRSLARSTAVLPPDDVLERGDIESQLHFRNGLITLGFRTFRGLKVAG
jgi:hypothetical protein